MPMSAATCSSGRRAAAREMARSDGMAALRDRDGVKIVPPQYFWCRVIQAYGQDPGSYRCGVEHFEWRRAGRSGAQRSPADDDCFGSRGLRAPSGVKRRQRHGQSVDDGVCAVADTLSDEAGRGHTGCFRRGFGFCAFGPVGGVLGAVSEDGERTLVVVGFDDGERLFRVVGSRVAPEPQTYRRRYGAEGEGALASVRVFAYCPVHTTNCNMKG